MFYNYLMTLDREIPRDAPKGYWMLSGTTPFTDYSGKGNSATGGGGTGIPLISGADNSTLATNAAPIVMPNNVFAKDSSFSLEAWVVPFLPTGSVADTQIIGNQNQMDGLVVNGTTISFRVKFAGSTAQCSYNIQDLRNVYVVGVYLVSKIQLWIDGELVDEEEITSAQQADTFGTVTTNLYSGTTSGGNNLMVNGLGVYSYGLTANSINRHFAIGRNEFNQNVDYLGGEDVLLSQEKIDVVFTNQWNSEVDWALGSVQNLNILDDELVPQEINDVSLTGRWRDSVDLYNYDTADILQGMILDWDGSGVTIKASLDGNTWTTVTRNRRLSLIPAGFNPAGKELFLEAYFPGGITDDESYLASLSLCAYTDTPTQINSSMDLTYVGTPHILNEVYPGKMADDWGTVFTTTSSAVIGTDADGDGYKTIEIWFKPLDSTINVQLVDTRTVGNTSAPYMRVGMNSGTNASQGFTTYLNGSAWSTQIPKVNQWSVAHLTYSSAILTDILINKLYNGTGNTGNVQIGKVVLYSDTLTAAQVKSAVKGYFGAESSTVNDNTTITMSESATPASVYAHDWSITAS